MTENEERLHFGLWAICKSPLILGNDLNKISSASLAIIKNKASHGGSHVPPPAFHSPNLPTLQGIIDINQDKLGKAATTFRPPGAAAPVSGQIYPYWAGPLSNGVVIGLIASNGAATLSVNFKDVPGLGSGSYSWKEMYSGRTGTGTSVSFSLGNHDMAVVLVTASDSSSPTTTSATPTQTNGGGSGCEAAKWEQCGGKEWKGCTKCASGSTCTVSNGEIPTVNNPRRIRIWLTMNRVVLAMSLKISESRYSKSSRRSRAWSCIRGPDTM